MANFAKLFQVTITNQVLLLTSFDEKKQLTTITQITVVDGKTFTVAIQYENEDQADAAYDAYNQEAADTFYLSCVDLYQNGHCGFDG